jgi:hypothetical protein
MKYDNSLLNKLISWSIHRSAHVDDRTAEVGKVEVFCYIVHNLATKIWKSEDCNVLTIHGRNNCVFIYLVVAVNLSKSAQIIQGKFTAYWTDMKTVRIWLPLESKVPYVGEVLKGNLEEGDVWTSIFLTRSLLESNKINVLFILKLWFSCFC